MVDFIPFKPNQPTVTFVPIRQTENPFFHLSYQRKKEIDNVKLEYTDEQGNFNKWQVRYNRDKDIGAPGIQAHEVWYLLIKPAIDDARKRYGKIPAIIPLGGMRESLRMVGWSAGGSQAKQLIRAITQISFAGCIAELWFPETTPNEEGKLDYKKITGRYNRLSVYAVGEQINISPEEIKDLDIDLEDKLYIRLDPMEIMFQELEVKFQKLIDNELMFSVKPSSRRWYELLANKVFGTVKNKAEFFEIKYSWYVKRHRPLKHYFERRRVVQQMNGVIKDLLDVGYLDKVEYKKIKSSDNETDFRIRYYPGEEARNSINRVKGFVKSKNRRGVVKVKRANYSGSRKLFGQNRTVRPTKAKKTAEGIPVSETLEEKRVEEQALSTLTKEHYKLLQILMVKHKISQSKAYELITKHFDRIEMQLEALPHRNADDETAILIRSIEENYSIPKEVYQAEEAEKARIAEAAKQEKERLDRLNTKKIIKNCVFCDDDEGLRYGMSEPQEILGKTTIFLSTRPCTHDLEEEQKLEYSGYSASRKETNKLIDQKRKELENNKSLTAGESKTD